MPLETKQLGVNYSLKKPVRRKSGKVRLSLVNAGKKVGLKDKRSTVYSGTLSAGSREIFDRSVVDVDPINELALTRVLIHEVLTSNDKGSRKMLPSLIRTVGELYDKIRRGVDGMRVVVSFKEPKFSREMTNQLSDGIGKMLEEISSGLCEECKTALRSNVSRYVERIIA